MRIVVEFDAPARADLLRLLRARTTGEGDALRFAQLYVDDMEAEFRSHAGPPPAAERHEIDGEGVWWWRYADGIWTLFRVTDRKSRFFGGAVRTIKVFAFRARPPAPAVPPGTPGT